LPNHNPPKSPVHRKFEPSFFGGDGWIVIVRLSREAKIRVGWVGADRETKMSFGTIATNQDDALIASGWCTSRECSSMLNQHASDYLSRRLPKDD
jgi:hypothetical protein